MLDYAQIAPHSVLHTYHVGELLLERPTPQHTWGVSINPSAYPLAARWLREAVQYQQWRTDSPLDQAVHPLIAIDTPERLFVEMNTRDTAVLMVVAAALARCCDIPLVYRQ